jgi:predicted aspartyl protease
METPTMGRVLVTVIVENLGNLFLAEKGVIPKDHIRRIEVPDALVDTGAWCLSLPKRLIALLGLEYLSTRNMRTAAGVKKADIFGSVRLTIMERDFITHVSEVPDDCPVLVGQIPLEAMDFVVDPKRERLIANPAHGGQWTVDLF